MYNASGTVYIKKGFMSFKSFWKKLREVREIYGDDIPYVMHFRISTQAGVKPDCTHPFPLSKSMKDLRMLEAETDIGVAHNGIISLTSDYGYKKEITYSDTMKFITDYLALIIQTKKWYNSTDTKQLIKNLMGSSKLAILDKYGHCELLGSGWIEDNGIWYSNGTYKSDKVWAYSGYSYWDSSSDRWTTSATKLDKYITRTDDEDEHDYGDDCYDLAESRCNPETGWYDLDPDTCPCTIMGDDTYCGVCYHGWKCWGGCYRPYADSSVYDDEEWALINK